MALLEVGMRQVQGDLGEIKESLKVLPTLPTKRDLFQNTAIMSTIGAAVVAITVGGIIAGLAWLQPKTTMPLASPAPIIIQVPAASNGPQPARQP